MRAFCSVCVCVCVCVYFVTCLIFLLFWTSHDIRPKSETHKTAWNFRVIEWYLVSFQVRYSRFYQSASCPHLRKIHWPPKTLFEAICYNIRNMFDNNYNYDIKTNSCVLIKILKQQQFTTLKQKYGIRGRDPV